LAAGPHLRLETFDPVSLLARRRIAQCPALARPHRYLPLDLPFALGPLVDADIAGVTERPRLAAVQQLMRLGHIGDVGWRADHAVHQAALGIDPDMGLHA